MIVAVTMCVFVSPLVVAGIVIGLVLFLSLLIIIIGSMRKKKQPHTDDECSFGGSTGELRSECVDEFPPAFDFDSYAETPVPHISPIYPDAPPHYDECMGRDATQIFTPTDDPPPYSHASHTPLESPCWWWAQGNAGPHQPISWQGVSSVFVLSVDELPPYDAVVEQQDRIIPLIGHRDAKHSTL